MIFELIEKYIEKAKKFLEKENIIYETKYSTVFLPKFSDSSHKMLETMVEEIKVFCDKKGYKIDKVIFFSGYIADVHDEKGLLKRAYMKNDSNLIIKKHKKEVIAILFEGSVVNFEYF